MKIIRFTAALLLVLLTTALCAAVDEEAPVLYYETEVSIGDVFELQQDYSMEIVDINSNDGDLWIRVSLDGDEVDNGFCREDDPYEYILEIEDEDDEDETEEYRIVRVSFIEKDEVDDETISEILIEQFLDPERSDSDFLMVGKGASVKENEEKELENGYVITSDDVDDDAATLILEKDGNILKQEEDLEEGDIFSYTVVDDGKINTIFMAYVKTLFEGTDSNTLILENVALREDEGIDSGLSLDISVDDISAGDEAIISYTLDEYVSRAEVFLDGELIDRRNEVDAGTYRAVTDELDAGTYEVTVSTVTEDGLEVEEELEFTVEDPVASIASPGPAGEETVGDVVENITSGMAGVEDNLNGIPGFGAFVAVLLLVSAFIWIRR
jgi:hypothetical protein